MKWEDITSYSQGDKERIPSSFKALILGTRIVVSRHIDHAPDAWLLSCNPWYNSAEFCTGCTAEEAQSKAIELVYSRLQQVLKALS